MSYIANIKNPSATWGRPTTPSHPVGRGHAPDARITSPDATACAAARQRALDEFDERIVIARTQAVYQELLDPPPSS